MARVRRRNQALKLFVNGKAAKSLHGLTDAVGGTLQRYDHAVTRAVVGLKRRASPAASRAVREVYGVRASALSGRFRVDDVPGRARGEDGDAISLFASARRLPLLEFGGRWGGRRTPGATAEVGRGERETYESSFIATVRGLKAIRVRQFDSTGRRAGRGPLRMLRGPSPWEMTSGISSPGSTRSLTVKRKVMAELTDFYLGELRRQFALARS